MDLTGRSKPEGKSLKYENLFSAYRLIKLDLPGPVTSKT